MEISRLQQLLTRNEGPKLDYKARLAIKTEGEKKELAKLVSAIANSRGGRGYLIYGIADKTREVVGINPAEFQEEKIQQIISSRCSPPIPIHVDVVPYSGKHLAVITIYRSEQRPHQLRDTGSFFIRRGSTTDTAQRAEIASMLQEVGLIIHETTPIYNASIADLNLTLIKQLLPSLESLTDELLLLTLISYGFVHRDADTNKIHPTTGGMLLFGFNINRYLPHANVKVIIPSSQRTFFLSGTVFEILDQFDALVEQLSLPLPLSVLNQALANALVHRDYWEIHRNVVVQIKSTWISITNPGSLIDPTVLTNEGEQNLSQPVRNPWLFQNLIILDPKKRFFRAGLGLKRIKLDLPASISAKFTNQPEKNQFQIGFIVKA